MAHRGSKHDLFESDASLSNAYSGQAQHTEARISRGTSRTSKAPSSDTDSAGNRLTYIDDDIDHYQSQHKKHLDESQDASLVYNAADVGRSGNYQDLGWFQPMRALALSYCIPEYLDPYDASRERPAEKSSPFIQLLSSGKYPLEQRIEDKKRGIGRQKYPFVGTLPTLLFEKLELKFTFSMGIDCYHDWGVYI